MRETFLGRVEKEAADDRVPAGGLPFVDLEEISGAHGERGGRVERIGVHVRDPQRAQLVRVALHITRLEGVGLDAHGAQMHEIVQYKVGGEEHKVRELARLGRVTHVSNLPAEAPESRAGDEHLRAGGQELTHGG